MSLRQRVKSTRVGTLGEIQSSLGEGREWIFRGQHCDCSLKTSLERACQNFSLPITSQKSLEEILLREFCRRAHHYEKNIPEDDDKIEWLSLMQHFGAPTRVLDWTYSPYIGIYFALERRAKEGNEAVLWAVDLRWAQNQIFSLISSLDRFKTLPDCCKEAIERFVIGSPSARDKIIGATFLMDSSIKCAFPVTPYRLNERMTVQKGLFLCSANLDFTFEENLCALSGFHENIFNFVIAAEARMPLLRELQKMNVDRTTLFPGLAGFAQSLSVYHHSVESIIKQSR